MKQTERYLQGATRGLWGQARRELRAELQGHIAERLHEFRLAGLSPEEAERQTLRELGAPVQVNAGMLDVHTVPALGKAGVLSALLATALFAALPQGLAQVKGIYTYTKGFGSTSYLNFEQLKAELVKTGGKISGTPETAEITVRGASRPSVPIANFGFQQPILMREGKAYLQIEALLFALLNSGSSLNIVGWEKPVLNAGQSNIHIDTQDWLIINNLYVSTLTMGSPITTEDFTVPARVVEPNVLSDMLKFEGEFAMDSVYALVIPTLGYWSGAGFDGTDKPVDGNLNFIYSANQAQAGNIQFHVPYNFKNFRLYSNTSDFQKALEPYNNIATAPVIQWDAQHPAPVLLLKLSGHFGPDACTVVSPTSVQKP